MCTHVFCAESGGNLTSPVAFYFPPESLGPPETTNDIKIWWKRGDGKGMNLHNTETEGNICTSCSEAQIPRVTEQQSACAEKHKILMTL